MLDHWNSCDTKWNWMIINQHYQLHLCFPAMTCQHGCCGKGLLGENISMLCFCLYLLSHFFLVYYIVALLIGCNDWIIHTIQKEKWLLWKGPITSMTLRFTSKWDEHSNSTSPFPVLFSWHQKCPQVILCPSSSQLNDAVSLLLLHIDLVGGLCGRQIGLESGCIPAWGESSCVVCVRSCRGGGIHSNFIELLWRHISHESSYGWDKLARE